MLTSRSFVIIIIIRHALNAIPLKPPVALRLAAQTYALFNTTGFLDQPSGSAANKATVAKAQLACARRIKIYD